LSSQRLSAAIGETLRNPEYRQNAVQMKKNIAEANGLDKAADLLEEAFTLHRAKGERSPAHIGA
jgi:zeaxanthin glucosyltransferase